MSYIQTAENIFRLVNLYGKKNQKEKGSLEGFFTPSHGSNKDLADIPMNCFPHVLRSLSTLTRALRRRGQND
jgi:hypothetical protein